MKKKFDQRIVLRIEMIILIVITIIAVTLAWFVLNNHSLVKGMNLTAQDDEYLRVALQPGGEDVDILTLSGNTVEADVQLPYYYNINEINSDRKLMAPGVYGQVDLYITALSPMLKQCSVSVNSIPEFIDSVSENSAQTEALGALLDGHIQFYQTRDEENKGTGYTGLITDENPLVVDLEENVEKKVTIYWIWFYEYRDIPAEGRLLDVSNYFDMDRYDSTLSPYDPTVSANDVLMADYITYYDYGDTKIGLSVDNVRFHIHVNALYGN
ncbi:MAG: hypothetical protein IJ711_07670 [Lachnospiraceae bacterium]|nr:hypothetical protein [Lachnospiraceae bacterium]